MLIDVVTWVLAMLTAISVGIGLFIAAFALTFAHALQHTPEAEQLWSDE